jgi:hypothetical protein
VTKRQIVGVRKRFIWNTGKTKKMEAIVNKDHFAFALHAQWLYRKLWEAPR